MLARLTVPPNLIYGVAAGLTVAVAASLVALA
jgi:hypothetical protein